MVDDSQALITFGAIFILCSIALAHQIQIYKIGFIHESGLYMMLGLLGGAIWLMIASEDTQYSFSPDMFFDVVLPPIIFAASYNLKRKQFINNFAAIMVLAIIGALINFLMMSTIAVQLGGFGLLDSECMLFAATMSATDGIAVVALIDSVAYPTIFGTLIGEGCINDAVAIILYSSIDDLAGNSDSFSFSAGDLLEMSGKVVITAILSILIGVGVGLVSALYFRMVRMQPSPKTELTLLFLFGYLSYSISDLSGESGIIAVFFCGVVMSHYTFHSLTHESKEASMEAFEAIGYMGETFIYISLGFYTFSYTDSANWSANFLVAMLLTLILGRMVVVGICVLMINMCRKRGEWISMKDQLVFWWGGIVRGSICFALSLKKTTEHSPIVVTTTFAIVIITTFTIGSLTETFLICIGMKDPDVKALAAPTMRKTTDLDAPDASRWKRMIYKFDDKYAKPIFGGRERRLHELSEDHPEFDAHYQKFQDKQASKMGAPRLPYKSAPMGALTVGYSNFAYASPMDAHPTNMNDSPYNEEDYGPLPTEARTQYAPQFTSPGLQNLNTQSVYNLNASQQSRNHMNNVNNSNTINQNNGTHSLPAHMLGNNGSETEELRTSAEDMTVASTNINGNGNINIDMDMDMDMDMHPGNHNNMNNMESDLRDPPPMTMAQYSDHTAQTRKSNKGKKGKKSKKSSKSSKQSSKFMQAGDELQLSDRHESYTGALLGNNNRRQKKVTDSYDDPTSTEFRNDEHDVIGDMHHFNDAHADADDETSNLSYMHNDVLPPNTSKRGRGFGGIQ